MHGVSRELPPIDRHTQDYMLAHLGFVPIDDAPENLLIFPGEALRATRVPNNGWVGDHRHESYPS
jgi:hypothetical protein